MLIKAYVYFILHKINLTNMILYVSIYIQTKYKGDLSYGTSCRTHLFHPR